MRWKGRLKEEIKIIEGRNISVDQGAHEVLSIFDVIKTKLNEMIIHGADNVNSQQISVIKDLKDKLKQIKLILLADHLEEFLDSLQKKDRDKIAKNILKIIAITRMFESIMSIELIKKDLIEWMEGKNAEGTN